MRITVKPTPVRITQMINTSYYFNTTTTLYIAERDIEVNYCTLKIIDRA